MRRHVFVIALLAALLPAGIPPAGAQTPPGESPGAPGPGGGRKNLADRNDRRLFQRFVEDAAISTGGWAELQYRYTNLSNGSEHFLGPLVAFKIVNNIEGGLRFGFLDVNPDPGSGESGLSDIDLFAKYRLPGGRGRAAFGVLAKVPTANEEEGLGTGKSDLEVFAAWRADLDAVSIVAHAGVRFNGDPDPPVPPTDNSLFFGGALILPASAALTLVIEATYETERFEGASDDARLTLGVQSRGRQGHTGIRGGVAIPLNDGAPDYEVLLGAFLTY
ncbi:MAG TPA: hypothetical protein VGV60_04355 [Candidatus Polarisedimenticolia bacterium]|jgi:hypothetical protein|nr:hypothetical protein [Candidatus Polarisedimenticolia bacterium]